MKAVEQLELHLSYRCNQRCSFCSEAGRMARFHTLPVTWGRLARVLREQAKAGIRSVHFTGGEPTLHPALERGLRLARKLGMRTVVGTNGAVLSSSRGARRLLPLLDEVMLSLHGPDAATHDAETGTPGSFARAMRAAAHVKEADGVALFTNTVLTRSTLPHVAETVGLAVELGAHLLVISNVSPEGRAAEDYAALAPPLGDLSVALPGLAVRFPDARLRFFGVPLCLLGEAAARSNDLHWDPRVTVEWTASPGRAAYAPVTSLDTGRGRAHVPACEGCARAGLCPGPFVGAPGLDALRPFHEVGP